MAFQGRCCRGGGRGASVYDTGNGEGRRRTDDDDHHEESDGGGADHGQSMD